MIAAVPSTLRMFDDGGLWHLVSRRDARARDLADRHYSRQTPGAADFMAEATRRTFSFWRAHYGALPSVPLTTEVDPAKTRRKRDPGRCFLRAGWTRQGEVRGLVVLRAPMETLS